jgi:hypothetical protein
MFLITLRWMSECECMCLELIFILKPEAYTDFYGFYFFSINLSHTCIQRYALRALLSSFGTFSLLMESLFSNNNALEYNIVYESSIWTERCALRLNSKFDWFAHQTRFSFSFSSLFSFYYFVLYRIQCTIYWIFVSFLIDFFLFLLILLSRHEK